jgi:nucleoside triphosphatase
LEIENIQFFGIQESIFPEDFHTKKHMVFFDFIAKVKESQKVILNDEFEDF